MRIESLHLRGFLGFPHDDSQKLEINRFGNMTVFIGPNNAGKSIPFRFLHFLRTHLPEPSTPRGIQTIQQSIFPDRFFWNHNHSEPVIGELKMQIDHPQVGWPLFGSAHLVHDHQFQITVEIRRTHNDAVSYKCIPSVLCNNEWQPSVLDDKWLRGHNTYKKEDIDGKLYAEFRNSFTNIIRKFEKQFYFFDTVRALDRSGTREMDDGSVLLNEFFQWQVNPERQREWKRFQTLLIFTLNDIFQHASIPEVESISITEPESQNKNQAPRLKVFFKVLPDLPVDIETMGTGISQMVILLAILLKDDTLPSVVFVEEPESNLHPGLLRRFIDILKSYPQHQFIFTTHSNVILDSLSEGDEVYHFQQDPENGACRATLCSGIIEKHNLLDSLGISGSSLLQSNCVIWVEGPSDRLYVRDWIEKEDPKLIEESDYSFVFYGGTLLAHYALETSENISEDVACMLSVARYSAVVMDRDLKPDELDDKLSPRKQAIMNAANEDETHRIAITTNGREIENDVDPDLFLVAISRMLAIAEDQLQELSLTGVEPYEEEIESYLTEKAITPKYAISRITDKPRLAREVIACSENAREKCKSPSYIKNLVDFIRKSRAL